jgi:hypothetical protein
MGLVRSIRKTQRKTTPDTFYIIAQRGGTHCGAQQRISFCSFRRLPVAVVGLSGGNRSKSSEAESPSNSISSVSRDASRLFSSGPLSRHPLGVRLLSPCVRCTPFVAVGPSRIRDAAKSCSRWASSRPAEVGGIKLSSFSNENWAHSKQLDTLLAAILNKKC